MMAMMDWLMLISKKKLGVSILCCVVGLKTMQVAPSAVEVWSESIVIIVVAFA